MKKRPVDLGRKVTRLESVYGDPRMCVCGIPPDKVTGTSQAIVSAYRGEDPSTICPACGRERLVLKLAFPRDGAF